MYSKRKMNKSLKQRHKGNGGRRTAAIIIFIMLAAGLISLGVIEQRILLDAKEKADDKSETLWVAADMIPQGTVMTKELMSQVTGVLPSGSECLAGSNVIGRIVKQDIPKGMILYDLLFSQSEHTQTEREIECEVVTLSKNLKEKDSVDVRIKFPNGEDYIVLSKKQVHNLKESEEGYELCYLWMEEEEILNFQAAVVDAYLYPGAYLYTAKYIDPDIQGASLVTYLPSLSTMALMEKDENLIATAADALKSQQRKSMEARLTQYKDKKIQAAEIIWDSEAETETVKEESFEGFEEEVP